MRERFAAILGLAVLFGTAAGAGAQTNPESIPGEVLLVPMHDEQIVVDGQLDDWANQLEVVTVSGPLPSTDPATTGELRWRLRADEGALYFAATITDAVISAGVTPDEPWNEDSIELYLNLSGEFQRTTFTERVYQLRLSAIDLGVTDTEALTLTGIGLGELEISGLVFPTADGWGVEARVGLDGLPELRDGSVFGVQVQANGSSGAGRDLKLSWSKADVNDVSFENPSVFGSAIVVDERSGELETNAAVDETTAPTSTSTTTPDSPSSSTTPDSPSSLVEPIAEEPVESTPPESLDAGGETDEASGSSGSSVLVIALIAVGIVGGGVFLQLWVRRRNESPHEDIDPDDPDDIEDLISSILD